MFASFVSPWRWTFAILPKRTLDGRLIWLMPIMTCRAHLHEWLTPRVRDEWNVYWFPWGYRKTNPEVRHG
jgi:hypothetical protein